MNASLYIVSILLFLNRCMGLLGIGLCGKTKLFDIDNYNYEGDPVRISCVYNESMTGFHQENITGDSEFSSTLVERLTNGKPLSLYIDGIMSSVKPDGSTFKFAREWSKASNTNVCYFTYAYVKNPNSIFQMCILTKRMLKSHRSQYVAKLARNLVLSIRDRCLTTGARGCWKDMSQVTVVGFSFGAHIASRICIDLYERTGQKVGKLIGTDPAGIYWTVKRFHQSFIKRGNAAYVQIIHTDTIFAGTFLQRGDIDIYITDLPVGIGQWHTFAPYIHMATSMKKLLLIAENNGKGQVIQIDGNSVQRDRTLKQNEVLVGVYGELDESKRGKRYYVSLKKHFKTLRNSIADVVKIKL